jgi:hypothetical protein
LLGHVTVQSLIVPAGQQLLGHVTVQSLIVPGGRTAVARTGPPLELVTTRNLGGFLCKGNLLLVKMKEKNLQ